MEICMKRDTNRRVRFDRPGQPQQLPFLIFSLLTVAALYGADTQTFTGVITDDMCGSAGHASMRMGSTDAECASACIGAHGAAYVLSAGKDVYILSDQRTPEEFAGRKVAVTGTLNAKTNTIQVQSIRAAE
jgi:hypothetical protein